MKPISYRCKERQDFVVSLLARTAALGHLDRIEETHDTAAKVMQKYPSSSLAKHERLVPIARAQDRARYLEGVHQAELPG